jgi:hypothetical protein
MTSKKVKKVMQQQSAIMAISRERRLQAWERVTPLQTVE